MITRFCDISHHNAPLDLSRIAGEVRGVALKATEGVGFVDGECDKWFQQAKQLGLKRAFYHFANLNSPTEEADFFIRNTENYFYDAVPVLDWEGCKAGDQSVAWVNEFVRRVHDRMGVWCWIYGNPWRFNQGGVEPNCMRWIARYPSGSMTFEQAEGYDRPKATGLVGAWQFTDTGRLDGYSGNLDLNLFYGDANAWRLYADPDASSSCDAGRDDSHSGSGVGIQTLENDTYRVTIERKA